MREMKAYKGFNKDMTCIGLQYKEGVEYETDHAKVCKGGFHACENPLDCLNYYAPNQSVYHEVEVNGDVDYGGYDTKVSATKIKIGARLSIAGIVKGAIGFVMNKASPMSGDGAHSTTSGYMARSATSSDRAHSVTSGTMARSATSGDCARSATSGDRAHSATSGDGAHSATSGHGAHSATCGDWAHSATSGDWAHSTTSGYMAHSATSGDWAHSATSGDGAHSVTYGTMAHSATSGNGAHSATSGNGAHSATSGDWAHSVTSGYGANSATSGDRAHSEVHGKDSIAAVLGKDCKARGGLGCWLVLTERYVDHHILGVQAVCIDGDKYKPDTWYTLKDGKVVEAVE